MFRSEIACHVKTGGRQTRSENAIGFAKKMESLFRRNPRKTEEQSTLGGARIFFGKDPRGVQVVAALLPVPGSPWLLVADQDASEVFGVWRTRTALMVVLRLLLAATIGAIALFLWQNTRTAYGQALYESQDQLKESLERRSITSESNR